MASTPRQKTLQSIDSNSMTPTAWLHSAKHVPYTSPAPLTPFRVPTPDSHTRRVGELSNKIEDSMTALLAPIGHSQEAPPNAMLSSQPRLVTPPATTVIEKNNASVKVEMQRVAREVGRLTMARAALFAVEILNHEELAALDKALSVAQSRQTEILDVLTHARPPPATDAEILAEPAPAQAPPTAAPGRPLTPPGTAPPASDAHVDVAPVRAHVTEPGNGKLKYAKAKEDLELGARGGMKMTGRHPCGTPSDTHSGFRFRFRCCHHSDTKCPASACINSDYSISVASTHKPPDKNSVTGEFIAGTGCERYGKFRGLHQSELEIVAAHNVTAPSSTNAKAVSNKIAEKKLAEKVKAEDAPNGDGGAQEHAFVKHTPSARSIRHTVNKAKAHSTVDLTSVGDIQTFVTKYWTERYKEHDHPPPCEVKVVDSESWESEPVPRVAPKSRKANKVAAAANPASDDVQSPSRTRKTSREPKEVAKQQNSIVVFSTVLLMTLCMSHSAASIDGTYRCAPARSTIADFGVFVGRAFVPCFLGILTGPRSGDTSEHWKRFLMIVKTALGGWSPRTCVRDHAACLINALNTVWELCAQIVCYFHLRQCIRRRRSKMPALLAKYKEIMHYIDVLHYTTEGNWSIAKRLIDEKLPKVFKEYFYGKTLHGDGMANEIWAHNTMEPGESMTNCAAERFHATLRSDPDMFNGVQKPAFMHCVGLLGNVIGAISFRCSVPSSVGPLLYTENADTTHGTRVRNAWRAGIVLVESGVLQRTHRCIRGTSFWFLAGGKPVTRAQVDALTSHKGRSAADYLAFFKLRRATTDSCDCIPFLKFGFCRHAYAVSVHINGMKFVPHGVLKHEARPVPDSDIEDHEPGDPVLDDASESDSGPDSDSAGEDDVVPATTTQRSRRPATIYNAMDF